MKMKSSLACAFLWAAMALGQEVPECSRELAATDDCADVINANACYNQFRFTSPRILTCIGGTDDADRVRKVCKCCGCVGQQMCDWVVQQGFQC